MFKHHNPDLVFDAVSDVLASLHEDGTENEVVIQLALERLGTLMGATCAMFAYVDHDARHLTVAQVAWPESWSHLVRRQFEMVRGAAARVAATGREELCRSSAAEPALYPIDEYAEAGALAPVTVGGAVLALIAVGGPDPDRFDVEALRLVKTFARLVAAALAQRKVEAERRKLQREISESRHLWSLGEALAGIVHEINNPLTSVLCFASVLEAELPRLGPSGREACQVIASEARRAADLLKSILTFARKDSPTGGPCDLGEVLRRTLLLRKFQCKTRRVKLEVEMPAAPVWVSGASNQLLQVMLNLVDNAVHAIARERSDGAIRLCLETREQTVRVRVSDNGSGIPLEAQPRIFEPFFTTKTAAEGTGLGLSVARELIAANGGRIALDSSSAEGSVFELTFAPADPSACGEAVEKAVRRESFSKRGRVLVVDDEPLVLDVVSRLLKRWGVIVECASRSGDALCRLRSERFDVIIADVYMPDMDGFRLHEAIRGLDTGRDTQIVFMSGGATNPQLEDFLRDHAVPFLPKPFSIEELQAGVASLLPTLHGTEANFEPVSATA